MKSIVRRDTGEDWQAVRHAADARGRQIETDQDRRRGAAALRQEAQEEGVERGLGLGDRSRRRITKMKDGRTHLALQGRARGRSGQRDSAGRRDPAGRPCRSAHARRQRDRSQNQLGSRGQRSRDRRGGGRQRLSRQRHVGAGRRPRLADATFPSRSRKTNASGPTSRRNSNGRWSTIAAAWPAPKASGSDDCGASVSNAASPTCATRAARAGLGCEDWKT